jgi:hypothetical protein
MVTVVDSTVKEISVRMGIYEEALAAVDETEEDRAVDPMVIKGNPEVIICPLKTINVVIPHTVIFGENNLHIVPPYIKLMTESVYDIGKATYFSYWCTLRCNHHNKHFSIPLIEFLVMIPNTFYHAS